jgi:hypothetical protein
MAASRTIGFPNIDALYQLPLGDFTVARNELAKKSGNAGADIRALEKPSIPAWGVNQLYWRERRAYDKLVRASERVRAAHQQALKARAGKKLDLAALEAQHMSAVKDASDKVAEILIKTGDPATPATLKAVLDTLQALPGPSAPGRLTKALAPIGFGAFGALMKTDMGSKALADVVTFAPPKPRADEAAAAVKRMAEINAKRVTELDGIFNRATKALIGARAKLERADTAKAAAESALQDAQRAADARRAEVARLEREARTADQERSRLKADTAARRQ